MQNVHDENENENETLRKQLKQYKSIVDKLGRAFVDVLDNKYVSEMYYNDAQEYLTWLRPVWLTPDAAAVEQAELAQLQIKINRIKIYRANHTLDHDVIATMDACQGAMEQRLEQLKTKYGQTK